MYDCDTGHKKYHISGHGIWTVDWVEGFLLMNGLDLLRFFFQIITELLFDQWFD